MSRIYLDHNATTSLASAAYEAMISAMKETGNPSSLHAQGRRARHFIQKARQIIASHLDVPSSSIIFTSGATEANNLAIKNFPGKVIVSAIEHPSVLKVRKDAILCPVTAQGQVDLEALDNLLLKASGSSYLVSIMTANNETGIIQPMEEVIALCRHRKVQIHSDGVQSFGKVSLPKGLDFLSISAHKIGGPFGVGALVIGPHASVIPLINGGGQERSLRSGTENVVGIIGFGAAVAWIFSQQWSSSLRDHLEKTLLETDPRVLIYGHSVPRLPNTSFFSRRGVKTALQIMQLDLQGISVSAGSACSSGKMSPSHVLQAMGVLQEDLDCSIRVSLGLQTTLEEINTFLQVWKKLYDHTG